MKLLNAEGEVPQKPCYIKALAKRIALTYKVDALGRVTVTLQGDCRIEYHRLNERRFHKWVEARVKKL